MEDQIKWFKIITDKNKVQDHISGEKKIIANNSAMVDFKFSISGASELCAI